MTALHGNVTRPPGDQLPRVVCCRRCGHRLTRADSRRLRLGPVCRRMILAGQLGHHHETTPGRAA